MIINARFKGVKFRVDVLIEDRWIEEWELLEVAESDDEDLLQFFGDYILDGKEDAFKEILWDAVQEERDDMDFWNDYDDKGF